MIFQELSMYLLKIWAIVIDSFDLPIEDDDMLSGKLT